MALRLGFFFMLRNWALRRLKLLAIAAAGVEMMTDIAIEKFRPADHAGIAGCDFGSATRSQYNL
jgi:hypothetical protein